MEGYSDDQKGMSLKAGLRKEREGGASLLSVLTLYLHIGVLKTGKVVLRRP